VERKIRWTPAQREIATFILTGKSIGEIMSLGYGRSNIERVRATLRKEGKIPDFSPKTFPENKMMLTIKVETEQGIELLRFSISKGMAGSFITFLGQNMNPPPVVAMQKRTG
jgi:hypothetical protein